MARQHSEDVLVYQEDDERFNIAAGRTRDGKYIVVESASHTTSEARVLRADDPAGSFAVIAPREDEHEYSVDHRNGLWFIRTNDRGRNFRLVTAPVATPGREHWTELIAHRDAVMLEDVDSLRDFSSPASARMGCRGCGCGSLPATGPEAAPRRRDRLPRAGLQRAPAHQPHL